MEERENHTFKPLCVTLPLEQYIEDRLTSLQTIIETRMDAADSALKLAKVENDSRLEKLNELKAMVVESNSLYPNAKEVDANFKQVRTDIADLRESRATIAGKASQTSFLFVAALSFLSMLISLAGVIIAAAKFLFG